MLTDTHTIWSYAVFGRFTRERYEMLAILVAAVVSDIEILFWSGMSLIDRFLNINPFLIDYNDLLHNTGISFWYWPLTLITNSILVTSVIAVALGLIFRRHRRICFLCWTIIQFHILLDALAHKKGNMLFWPLSTQKYLGLFEFTGCPIWVIALEQAISFGLLAWIIIKNKQPTEGYV